MTSSTVILIGPPGAGKTTVGKLLANRIGVPFADSDALISDRAGTIAAIFAEHGEHGFRDLEYEIIREALAGNYGVLALGGGAVTHAPTYALLAAHPQIVELIVDSDTATTRIGDTTHRPLLSVADGHSTDDGDATDAPDAADAAEREERMTRQKTWTSLVEPRLKRYRDLAAFRIDTAHRSPHEVATQISEWLEQQRKVS